MKYHRVAAFDAAVRCGGIRAGARELGLTQGAVTKAVRELEQDIGMPLLVRGARGISVTEFGQRFADHARLLTTRMEAMREEVRQARALKGGVIRVGISAAVAEMVLAPVIARFRSRQPNVRLRIVEATLPESVSALRDGSLAFAVAAAGSVMASTDFTASPLFSLPRVIACRPDHPLTRQCASSQLADQTWVLPTDPADPRDPMRDFFLRIAGRLPEQIVELTSLHGAIALVAASDMLCAMPGAIFALDHVKNRLVTLTLPDAVPSSDYAVVRRADTPLSPAALMLCDLLQDSAKSIGATQDSTVRIAAQEAALSVDRENA